MANTTGKKFGGRKKGSQNKITADLKGMILEALDKAGGVDYLIAQSRDNPTAFLTLVGKIIPTDTNVTGDLTIKIVRFSGDNHITE